jgi:hypothetical protein
MAPKAVVLETDVTHVATIVFGDPMVWLVEVQVNVPDVGASVQVTVPVACGFVDGGSTVAVNVRVVLPDGRLIVSGLLDTTTVGVGIDVALYAGLRTTNERVSASPDGAVASKVTSSMPLRVEARSAWVLHDVKVPASESRYWILCIPIV